MAQPPNPFDNIMSLAAEAVNNVDVDAIAAQVNAAGEAIGARAADIKDAAISTKDDITAKITELDRMLEQAITEYNDAYTLMSDKGMRLYIARQRSCDSIALVESIVNSIANHPKSFDDDFAAIDTHRDEFANSLEFADRELQAARQAAGGAGAGLAAGASVAFMAPTAAMWIATTFGTASTGAAISTLSGAAATNAALAWLGGGALAAGGGGTAAGTALLALAGPVGMAIAGATLLSSIVLFSANQLKLNEQKSEEIESVKKNTKSVLEMDAKIAALLEQTESLRESLSGASVDCLSYYAKDYQSLDDASKMELGSLVNNTLTLSKLLSKTLS
jgi:hypothetical protein